MNRLLFCLLNTCIVVALISCASSSKPKLTDEEILTQVEKYNLTAPEEKQLVCTRQKIMGSVIPQVTCRTKAQIALEKQKADDVTKETKSVGSNTFEDIRKRETN